MAKTLRDEDLSFLDRAPIVARAEVEVDAPPDRIWPALVDAEAWIEWFAGVKDAHYTSTEPHGVGSTRFVHVKSLKANEEVLACDENERFAFRVCDVNQPALAAVVEEVTLEPSGEATTVVYRQAVELAGWARPAAPMIRRQLQGALGKGLAGLPGWVAAHP